MVPWPEAFVGREAAFRDLARVIDGAADGRGTFVVVSGEAGIGKTRLVEEATADRFVLWGRASRDDSLGTLWLWRQVLRAAIRAGVELPSEAEAVLDDRGSHGRMIDARVRCEAVVAALRVVAAHRAGVVVVLDDVHWADNESMTTLRAVVLERDDLPLALVVTTRVETGERWPRPDLAVTLSGLPRDAVFELVANVLGGPPPDASVDVTVRRTAGNPFFVIELARALCSSERSAEPDAWEQALPSTALELLIQRLAAMPDSVNEVLLAVAVLGMEADPSMVATILESTLADIAQQLDEAADAGLVRRRTSTTIELSHALMRDALLHAASPPRRERLHAEAARALGARGDDALAGAVARHHEMAGDRGAASMWARRAGAHAQARAEHDEASGWYRMALRLGDVSRDDHSGEVMVALAESLSRVGELPEARSLFEQGAALARARDDGQAFAQAALGIGSLGGAFEVELLDATHIALLEEALERLGSTPSATRAQLLARLSVALTLQDQYDRREALADEAVVLARRSDDDRALIAALAAWCDVHAGPSHVDERLGLSQEQVAAATRLGDPELQLLAHRFRIVALMEAGEVRAATGEIQTFARIADRLCLPAYRWYARVAEGMLALLHGDLDEAERLAQLAIEDGRRAKSSNAMMLAKGGLLASVLRERGDRDGFVRTIAAGNDGLLEADRGFSFVHPLFLVGYGFDVPEVPEILRRLPDDISWADHDGLYLFIWAHIGSGAAYVRDKAWMIRAFEHLERYADRLVLDGTASVCLGPVALPLARMLAARGEIDDADRMYARACEQLRQIDARLLLDRVERERRDGPHQLDSVVEPTKASEVDPPNSFSRDGTTWLVTFGGSSARFRDSKGMRDLALLVARPHHDVHALDLVAAADGTTANETHRATQGDVGPNLDVTARAAYERRIRDLTELLEEAEAANDLVRAAALDDERAVLLRELAGALGLSGRPRPQGTDAERARKAVSMRLRDAIRRIGTELPELQRHLEYSVRTGVFCSYRPERPVTWV
jgi:hypothetical protein